MCLVIQNLLYKITLIYQESGEKRFGELLSVLGSGLVDKKCGLSTLVRGLTQQHQGVTHREQVRTAIETGVQQGGRLCDVLKQGMCYKAKKVFLVIKQVTCTTVSSLSSLSSFASSTWECHL